jgi:hypothetical protein
MSAANWGGSAAGGGIDFQAATSAICLVHMAAGAPLRWSAAESDIPVSVSAETGGAGDDIALTLADGSVVEVQAKKRLRDSLELWSSLLALCQRVHVDASFYGVLAVGPATSDAIRNVFARDVIRIGQGRTDDLSGLATKFTTKLSAASLPYSVCSRVRIHTVHVLEEDGASSLAALAYLANVSTQPGLAWERLKAEGLRMIKLRGRQDAVSVAGIIPGLQAGTPGEKSPAVIAQQLLDWTLETTGMFTIPAVAHRFSLDDDWIELKAYGDEKIERGLNSLEEALTRYHDTVSNQTATSGREVFAAETLGYFVRHCVVVAGPGMGKSQLLRRIARLLTRKREPSLIVPLRRLAERMRSGETFVDAALRLGLDASPLKSDDVSAIGIQNLTLLLDGLDESGTEQEDIAKAVVALTAAYPRCRIVFTTRPIGYETSLLSTWRHYELAQIDTSDARRGIGYLVDAASAEENPKIAEATAAALRHLDYRRGSTFSAKSPLLIALLASLALNEVVATSTNEGLYEQLFKLIGRMTFGSQNGSPSVLNAFLQRLGWELTAQPYADAEHLLSACAEGLSAELGVTSLKGRSISEEALSYWERSGIVERVRFRLSETFTFVHKTFGEYAAARYLVSRVAGERTQMLAALEPEQRWKEVLVFASALGLGQDLVRQSILSSQNGKGSRRPLQWAKYSKDQLDPDLARALLDEARKIIEGSHSRQALEAGVELVAAANNIPGAAAYANACRGHTRWWTALVGWTCFAQCESESLDFSSLLAFMESCVENADTRTLSGGFEVHSPSSDLWVTLLTAAVREAMRRGIGPEEQRFIDLVETSYGARAMGCIGEYTYILERAGIPLRHPKQERLLPDYFGSNFFQDERKDQLTILEAIADGSNEQPAPSEPPLQLSAFWYGTGLMSLETSAASLSSGDANEDAAREVIKLAARATAYDYSQLVAEAHAQIRVLKEDSSLTKWLRLQPVDAPLTWTAPSGKTAKSVISRALLHPSTCIVVLAVNLAEHLLTAADAAKVIPQVLAKCEGTGTAGAAHLAIHFLGETRARELLVARLKLPLNTGSQHLLRYLAELGGAPLDGQVAEILKSALSFGPRTAEAALELFRASRQPHRKDLVTLLREAYDHWLVNEEPYPIGSGSIPESPRGAILTQLIEEDAVSEDVLYDAAKDHRTEVSKPATHALLRLLSTVETRRNEFVRRLIAGQISNSLLAESLRAGIPFSKLDVQSIATRLESDDPHSRYAAVGILTLQYLKSEEISVRGKKLLQDQYQRLQDKGLEILVAQRLVAKN